VADYRNEDRLFNFTALRWQPCRPITIDYALEYHRRKENPDVSQVTFMYPARVGFLKALGFDSSPYVLKNRSDSVPSSNALASDLTIHRPRNDANHQMQTLTGAWDVGEINGLGAVTLKSISVYRSFLNDNVSATVEGQPLHILDSNARIDTQSWSEELQVIGAGPRVHYVVGLYYFGEYDSWISQSVIFKGLSRSNYKNYRKNKSYAGYGQVTWTPPILGDKLSLTAGVRMTQEQIHLTHLFVGFSSPTGKPVFVSEGGKAFGGIQGPGTPGVDPMGDISYQWTNDLMTYFRVSRGFTSGGFNSSATSPALFREFRPETLWQFESGIKSQWFDNRLRVNADGYFSYYKDLQQSVARFSPELGVYSVASNVDRAEIWGMEVEATAIPFRGVEATVGYSFLAPKFTKWLDQKVDAANHPILDSSGNPVLENVADRRSFAYSPRNQISGGVTYTAPPTAAGTFSARCVLAGQGYVRPCR
jgi:iron complex outermembrane receptor protein